MAMKVSRRDIENGMAHIRSYTAKIERDQARSETYVGHLVEGGEVILGGLLTGVAAGRYGAMSLGPIPADALVGLALHGLGLAGLFGKYADHAYNIANGVLAGSATKYGAGLGTEWRLRAGQSPFTTSGDGGAYGPPDQMGPGNPWQQGGGLSEEQLATIAAMG